MENANAKEAGLTRRTFIRSSAAAAAGVSALMHSGNFAYAAGSDVMRVGLVGCGGRGTGAAVNAVEAAEGVEIYAMGDLFGDRLEASRRRLKEHLGDRLRVTDARAFTGFDNYRHVIDSDVDYVILATPPGFRPAQFRYAVDAGKHVFMEKPSHVDAAGYHAILEAGAAADEKGLSVVAGTLYRRQPSFMDAIAEIHDGMIGEITGAYAYYMTGPIWLRPRLPGMSDMEWQCRNWYYFTWLSGDHIVEQFVHNLDVIQWVMGQTPESALAMGGRLARVDPSYGHIYDHFSVEYAFPGDVRVEAKCRQFEGAAGRVTNRIVGTKGIADLHPDSSIIRSRDGDVLFRRSEKGNNAYVVEHTDLIAAIRAGEPINETRQVADSTMIAVLGRESAYTGQRLTWEDMVTADLDLLPPALAFGDLPDVPVPAPGRTRLNRSFLAAGGPE